jgi:hypothetical protein
MTIAELVNQARFDILSDEKEDFQWSDEQLTRFANEAILEACKRVPLITRSYTLQVLTGISTLSIDPSIREITRLKLASEANPLDQTTDEELRLSVGASWREKTGTPLRYIKNKHALRFYPIPIADSSITIETINNPDDDFWLDDDINLAFQKGLLYYIGYKAYSVDDIDRGNTNEAQRYMSLFNEFFGLPKSARLETFQQDMPMYATIMSGRLC